MLLKKESMHFRVCIVQRECLEISRLNGGSEIFPFLNATTLELFGDGCLRFVDGKSVKI